MNNKIIIATGGTGGHIFPALTTAKSLSESGSEVVIFCDKNYKKYCDIEGFSNINKVIFSSQIKREFIFLIKSFLKISLGVIQSCFWIIRYRPKVIVGFGGYATFPILIAAIIFRKKIILHEQNAYLGKVNRIFAKFAYKIALSYAETDGIKDKFIKKTVFTGNPIREKIVNLAQHDYSVPQLSLEIDQFPKNMGYNVLLASERNKVQNNKDKPSLFNILIIGGSGGAKIFSDILPKAFFNISTYIKNKINITQQCKATYCVETFNQYKNFNLNITVKEFFEDIDQKIHDAHLIIARSGSSSISEFTAAKKPMILVPFAAAADNHQEKNARYIERNGGAVVIKEEDFTINNVSDILEKLIDNPCILTQMSADAFKCASIDATKTLVKVINYENE